MPSSLFSPTLYACFCDSRPLSRQGLRRKVSGALVQLRESLLGCSRAFSKIRPCLRRFFFLFFPTLYACFCDSRPLRRKVFAVRFQVPWYS